MTNKIYEVKEKNGREYNETEFGWLLLKIKNDYEKERAEINPDTVIYDFDGTFFIPTSCKVEEVYTTINKAGIMGKGIQDINNLKSKLEKELEIKLEELK